MKERERNETYLVRRNRSQHRRIRKPHLGCCWLCRFTVDDSAKSRSETDVDGPNKVSSYRFRKYLEDKGSITAEFAIVLPAVLIVLYFSLAVLSLETSRVSLVEVAAESSRALARGESESLVQQILQESGQGKSLTYKTVYSDLSICVEVIQIANIQGLGGIFPIELNEVQCARKGGL